MSQAYLSVDDWIERNCAPHEDCMPALRRLREQLIAGEFGVTGWRCTWDRYGRLMATDKVRQPIPPLAILDLKFDCLPSRSDIVLIRNNDWFSEDVNPPPRERSEIKWISEDGTCSTEPEGWAELYLHERGRNSFPTETDQTHSAKAIQEEPVYRTGLPGKPTSWHLVQAECRRRWQAGERHPGNIGESRSGWARILIEWLKRERPPKLVMLQRPILSTPSNIGRLYRASVAVYLSCCATTRAEQERKLGRASQEQTGLDCPVEVVYRRIEQLRPDPKNPRRHTAKQIRQIAESIRSFGFNVPILVDAELKIIAGHGRLLACRLLGRSEVPTISLEHLSPAQARAFMIADNRLTEIGGWDDRLLGEQLRELSELSLDFSLEVTGFDMPEIDLLIEGASGTPEDDPDDAPLPVATGPAVTRPGDTWLLGPHRLYCGSALEPEAYRVLMGEARAAMVFTDPPYNVPIDGHCVGNGKVRHREFAMAAGEMDEVEFTSFLTQALGHLAANSRDGSLHFICMDWRHIGELLAAGKRTYTELKNLCVWAKDNAGMGSLYRSQHELVFVFKHGRDPHRNHIQLGRYGRNRSNVWNYPGVNSFSRTGAEGNLLAVHPTVKPVALVVDALRDCSSRGEIVLDGFLGSGTTLIAAERTGRICHGLELDPLYVDTAIRRWQMLTAQQARHAASDGLFDDLVAEIGAAA